MTNNLNGRFFDNIGATDHFGFRYETYKVVYAPSTMVLFSRQTNTPLAALTLKADDVGCSAVLNSRQGPTISEGNYFQGMLNMSNQPFTITISNLSTTGKILFDVLHNRRVASRLNQVNILHPNQSYTVEADKSNNNRKLILMGQTNDINDQNCSEGKQVAITVDESERDSSNGFNFHLCVTPSRSSKELIDQFSEGTLWEVVPGFIRRIPL